MCRIPSNYFQINSNNQNNINCDLYSLLEDKIELVSKNSPQVSETSPTFINCHLDTTYPNFSQLLSNNAKSIYDDYLSITTSTITVSPNVPVGYSENNLLFSFHKKDLQAIDLYSAKLSNSSNIILSETDIEFLKQNMESPVYNFTLLVVSFVTVNSYFKSEHCAKSNLYFSHINYLFHYFSLQSIQSSLTDTNRYYLNRAYMLLSIYFNEQC
ncbi:hypothetical protein K502DRAFT_351663 [Neoconidiobolus thromboides FSU 785]|nr:hypothetical protein K502DRAFT_351663 [Neoconidiobolus thromboides FSU 785]